MWRVLVTNRLSQAVTSISRTYMGVILQPTPPICSRNGSSVPLITSHRGQIRLNPACRRFCSEKSPGGKEPNRPNVPKERQNEQSTEPTGNSSGSTANKNSTQSQKERIPQGFQYFYAARKPVKKSDGKVHKSEQRQAAEQQQESQRPNSTQSAEKGKQSSKPNRPGSPTPKNARNEEAESNPWAATLLLIVALTVMSAFNNSTNNSMDTNWVDFVNEMLAHGEVERIIVQPQNNRIYVKLQPNAVLYGKEVPPYIRPSFTLGSVAKIEEKMEEIQTNLHIDPKDFVPIHYYYDSGLGDVVWELLPMFAIMALVMLFLRSVRTNAPGRGMGGRGGGGGMFGGGGGGSNSSGGFDPSNPFAFGRASPSMTVGGDGTSKVSFADVAGMIEAKQELMEFVAFLKDPDRFTILGANIPKGGLLVGPPGTGKTLLAKAVAGEADVPFFSMAGSDFVEIFVGVGPSRVRDLFAQARDRAPAIIYIDEIDAIGRARDSGGAGGGNSERENTLNQLLVEMDGFNTTAGIIMLASTNRADILDKALLRPGRFDRQIEVSLPDMSERKAIFSLHMKPLTLSEKTDTNVLAGRMATLTPGFSGADIANCCNEAALHAARYSKAVVDAKDFDYAIDRILAGMEKRTRVMSQEERSIVAHHEAGHVVAGWFLEYADTILKVSIVPRSKTALGFSQKLPTDQKLYTTQQLFDRMCQSLGGRVAEELVYGETSTGASDDLARVTKLAYSQIVTWGMNERVGPMSWHIPEEGEWKKRDYSDALAQVIDGEARALVEKALVNTRQLLTKHMDHLKKVAVLLLEKETLQHEDLVSILGPSPYRHSSPYHIAEEDSS